MSAFKKLNKINGFDFENLKNAKQNNYAWCMAEFNGYIYVGTARNIPWNTVGLLGQDAVAPLLISNDMRDNTGEIWRYKKDESLPWKRVYKGEQASGIDGFRYMVVHASENSTPALYAASFSIQGNMVILKTTDGSNWTEVSTGITGGSSRAMISLNGILYVAVIDDSLGIGGDTPLLYYSKDPEFFDFKLVFDPEDPALIPEKNPMGGIDNIIEFNNKLYVCVSTEEGMEVWKSNTSTPKLNDWTLVADKGFGDSLNKNAMAVAVYDDYLYITATKEIPLIYLVPLGADIIRIDENDNWEVIVGGEPVIPSDPETGVRNISRSGYRSGFSNPFNVYIWQIREYSDCLVATTFDHGTNMEVLRNVVLLNKDIIVNRVGEDLYNLILKLYDTVLYLFDKFNYQKGFDLYVSIDGIHFKALNLSGLGNPHNYGGRMLMVEDNYLYLGTANPFEGCEVLKINEVSFNKMLRYDSRSGYRNGLENYIDEIEKLYDEILNTLKKYEMLNADIDKFTI